ncbi:MAG: hypothetical protein V3R96_02230 [Dehalococcoidales bacterium]
MESLLIALVSVALVIIATVTMTISAFGSAITLTDSWNKMEKRAEDVRRTSIAVTPPDNYAGGNIALLVINDGQTDLSDFTHWDIITENQTGSIWYIDYTPDAPGNNQWTLEGIYLTSNLSTTEAFDFNILNPGETANLTIKLSPEIGAGKLGKITVSTPNGVTAQCIVSRS